MAIFSNWRGCIETTDLFSTVQLDKTNNDNDNEHDNDNDSENDNDNSILPVSSQSSLFLTIKEGKWFFFGRISS